MPPHYANPWGSTSKTYPIVKYHPGSPGRREFKDIESTFNVVGTAVKVTLPIDLKVHPLRHTWGFL
eukprot:3226868-Amphidinium_carterae.1